MQPRANGTEKGEPQVCVTQQMNDNFSNCLAEEKRRRCNYAFLFGDDYLCTHPRHRDFR